MKRTALVVDDEEPIREYLCHILNGLNFDTLTAIDGKHALKALAARTVDLIITDLVMEDGEGIETIMAIRKQNKKNADYRNFGR